MRFLQVIVTLFLWISILVLTDVNEMQSDGFFKMGYPKRFVEIYFNEFTGKDVVTWFPLGIILNILLLILIYIALDQIRKKIPARKKRTTVNS